MYQYTLSLDGESVSVRSETDLSPIFTKWKDLLHFTGVGVSPGGSHEFVVEYENAPSKPAHYSDNSVQVTVPIQQLQTGELLLYAALPFLEVLHQRKQVVTMHAAAVELGGRAIMLLGKAGAGKTSLTISLCRNHGARLVGNDIVKIRLVGESAFAYAGSKYFFLRKESIKRNIPDLLGMFPQSGKDPWTHKIYCLPDRLGISTCVGEMPIVKSYLVHVDETMNELYTTSADRMDTRLYLNENMSRYIRGTAVALFGGSSQLMGYIPSFDTPDFFDMRVRLIEGLILSTKMVYLSGSLQDTCSYITGETGR
ncbi:MAG: hypothetical protein WCI52_03120 [bacterium]